MFRTSTHFLTWLLLIIQGLALCDCRLQSLSSAPEASSDASGFIDDYGSGLPASGCNAVGRACSSEAVTGVLSQREHDFDGPDLIAVVIAIVGFKPDNYSAAQTFRDSAVHGAPAPSRILPLLI